MEERQVTIEGVTLPLPSSMFVIAAQNPIESEGTYMQDAVRKLREDKS